MPLKSLKWNRILFGVFIVSLGLTLCFADISGSLNEKHIAERLKPIGQVNVEASGNEPSKEAAAATPLEPGQKLYEQLCKTCHETGLAEAPKFANKKDWSPRIAQGLATLYKHAIEGYKGMPAKGGCSTCSDEDIKQAVEYMVNKAK